MIKIWEHDKKQLEVDGPEFSLGKRFWQFVIVILTLMAVITAFNFNTSNPPKRDVVAEHEYYERKVSEEKGRLWGLLALFIKDGYDKISEEK